MFHQHLLVVCLTVLNVPNIRFLWQCVILLRVNVIRFLLLNLALVRLTAQLKVLIEHILLICLHRICLVWIAILDKIVVGRPFLMRVQNQRSVSLSLHKGRWRQTPCPLFKVILPLAVDDLAELLVLLLQFIRDLAPQN